MAIHKQLLPTTDYLSRDIFFNVSAVPGGIDLLHSPPGHPPSNGLAENSVQIVKNILNKKFLENQRIISEKVFQNKFMPTRDQH